MGIASPDRVGGEEKFRSWVEAHHHGRMGYLARDVTKRFNPTAAFPGARSVICLPVSYAPDSPADENHSGTGSGARGRVARYARGRDYHKVLKKRSRKLMDAIRGLVPHFDGKAFVDSGPLSERSLAASAGLGWIGRNGCLIVPGVGSYVVLTEIVCNLPLPPGAAMENRCRDCRTCLHTCPTGALLEDSLIDARRCLSYLTIEHSASVPEQLREVWGACVFGCDACQEPCPHNRNCPPGDRELISSTHGAGIHHELLGDLLEWNPERWEAATRGSATRRSGFERFMRNAILAAAGTRDASLTAPLLRLRIRQPRFAELIDWTVNRLKLL